MMKKEMPLVVIDQKDHACCILRSMFSAALVGDIRKSDLRDDNYACFQR